MDLRELLKSTTEPLTNVERGGTTLTPEDGVIYWIVKGLKEDGKS
jgi:hypothetical protein